MSDQSTLRAALAAVHLHVAGKLAGHGMPVLMIAEANTHDLIISGNSTYKVYDPVLVVYAGQLSNAQLGLLKRSLGMDSDTPRVLALPGFSVTHQGGEVHHKPIPVHKDTLR